MCGCPASLRRKAEDGQMKEVEEICMRDQIKEEGNTETLGKKIRAGGQASV